jgi:hypothetical protein
VDPPVPTHDSVPTIRLATELKPILDAICGRTVINKTKLATATTTIRARGCQRFMAHPISPACSSRGQPYWRRHRSTPEITTHSENVTFRPKVGGLRGGVGGRCGSRPFSGQPSSTAVDRLSDPNGRSGSRHPTLGRRRPSTTRASSVFGCPRSEPRREKARASTCSLGLSQTTGISTEAGLFRPLQLLAEFLTVVLQRHVLHDRLARQDNHTRLLRRLHPYVTAAALCDVAGVEQVITRGQSREVVGVALLRRFRH